MSSSRATKAVTDFKDRRVNRRFQCAQNADLTERSHTRPDPDDTKVPQRLASDSPSGHSARMPKPALKPDEHEIETHRANRSQGSRSVGGHLLLTDQRVLFYAHRIDSSTGGKAWSCDLRSITNVDLAKRGRNPFDGSVRRRLRIECGGAIELFVVNKAESIADTIRRVADRRASPDQPG